MKIRKLYELVVDDSELSVILNCLYHTGNAAARGDKINGIDAADIEIMAAMRATIGNLPKD